MSYTVTITVFVIVVAPVVSFNTIIPNIHAVGVNKNLSHDNIGIMVFSCGYALGVFRQRQLVLVCVVYLNSGVSHNAIQ